MRRTIRSILAVVAASGSVSAWAERVDQYDLQIERQPIRAALIDFGLQTGLGVSFIARQTSDDLVGPLNGRYTADAALSHIIENTKLTFSRVNATSVVISDRRDRNIRLATLDAQSEATASAGTQPNQPARTSGQVFDTPARESRELEEVIVTAQRREERLQDVPVSISVLRGEDLDKSTLQGISETLGRVPGVAAPLALQGGGTQLTVRGVSAANPVFTGSSAIAYYLDSVPFALVKNAITPDADAYDLQRVEVLRGPQGTLYGAGSLNGVVRVLTNDADLTDFEFKARGLVSSTQYGGENARGDLAVNVPLITDKLAARAVVSYGNLSGWIDKPGNEDANDGELLSARLKVNAQPTEQLSIGLSAWASRADYGAASFSDDNRTFPALLDESIGSDYDVYGLKVGYDFAPFTLTSASSYLEYTNNSFLDETLDGTPGFRLQTQFKAKTFAQEINLTSTGSGAWRWAAGGIYRDSKDVVYQNGNMIFEAPQQDAYHSESFAVFGELTRLFLDGRIELTGGLRYFEDRLVEEEQSHFLVTEPTAGVYGRATFDAVSPRVVANWKPSDDMTLYASYSEGFRSGSHHSPSIVALNPSFRPTEPDTLTNYEIGMKGSLMDGKLVADAAMFYIDWRDVQQTLRVPVTDVVTLSTIVNSKSASGMGFEFGLTARPFDRLTLGANLSWNDLRFDEDVPSGSIIIFHKNDRLNFSPEYTAGASADYSFMLGQQGYEGTLSMSVNYTSPLRARRPTSTRVLVSDGDSMLIGSVRFSVDSVNHWTATLFVDNVNNEQNAFVKNWLGVPEWDMRIRPRTAGLQLEYRF